VPGPSSPARLRGEIRLAGPRILPECFILPLLLLLLLSRGALRWGVVVVGALDSPPSPLPVLVLVPPPVIMSAIRCRSLGDFCFFLPGIL
jgi:hypothetical protein